LSFVNVALCQVQISLSD